jgi:hypothetical protein
LASHHGISFAVGGQSSSGSMPAAGADRIITWSERSAPLMNGASER